MPHYSVHPLALSARLARLAAAALLACAALPAAAQYKVVQPDGSVTYTDRPPLTGNARITPLGRGATNIPADSGLPAELRQPVARYPVTLYTSEDCAPCESGRRLLQGRGVPYSERRVSSEEDVQALERLAGGRAVPALTIGVQPLRGFSETDWHAYLDVAGYPRASRLPAGWPVPQATPLAPRTPPAPPVAPAPPPLPAEPVAPASGVRF